MFAVAVIASACSKEKKLNRKLNGDWDIVTMDGTALPSGTTATISFDKDKKAGTYVFTMTAGGVTDTENGTYELIEDTKIIMTENGSTDKDTSLVASYSKSDLKITDTDGTFPIELKKK